MTHRNPRTRAAIAALALTLGANAVAPTAWAGDSSPRATQATPIANAAAAKVGAMDPSKDLRAAQAPAAAAGTTTESRPFFKSPKGAIAIVMMAGVMAYTIHSRTCCAIHSPGR